MKKKSIFVIICCILSTLLFISIFVLSALVSKQSTKIVGPKQISGVEKESGESNKYSYVFGSDTVNGEINWLLETDPEQPLANNNISWKKLDGATGVITWTGNLVVDTYNLVLRAAIKDQSLKNAKLDITLKISTPSLTIVGPTEINDSNLNYESSEYSLYIGEEDVTNDSKYIWILLTLSNISGNYESDNNINVTTNHKIVWNKNLINNSYKLKLRIIEGENTWDKDIVLTLTRPRISLNYDNNAILNNTKTHTYDYNNSGPTNSKEFKALGNNNVDISNQVLWQTNIIASSTSNLDEAEKIFFNIYHKFQWDSTIRAGKYTFELKASNMQYLDSSTITFILEVPSVPIEISDNPTAQPTDLQGDFYNVGTTSGNGRYLAGVSTSVYQLYRQNTLLPNASEQTWEIRSANNFFDTSNTHQLLNTDIWYNTSDHKIHWNKNLAYNAIFDLELWGISSESIYYDWTHISIRFNCNWGEIDTTIYTDTGDALNLDNNKTFIIKTPFFSDYNILYDTCLSNLYFSIDSFNNINELINDKITYELVALKYFDITSDPDWNYTKNPNWNDPNNVHDITGSPNIQFSSSDIEWTYELTPYYIYQLKIAYRNIDSTFTFYDENMFFYIELRFTYDYIKLTNGTILPFLNLKQPDDWTTATNNSTSANWIYYDYPRTTGAIDWTSPALALRKEIVRSQISEAYLTLNFPGNPIYPIFPQGFLQCFFANCTSLKRAYISINANASATTPYQTFSNKNVYRETFLECSSLTDVIIKYNRCRPIGLPNGGSGDWDFSYSYYQMFYGCIKLSGITMATPFAWPGEKLDPTVVWYGGPSWNKNLNYSYICQRMFQDCGSLEWGDRTNANDTQFATCLGGAPNNYSSGTSYSYNTTGLYKWFLQSSQSPMTTAAIIAKINAENYIPANDRHYGTVDATDGDLNTQVAPGNNITTGFVVTNDEFRKAQDYTIVFKGAIKTNFLIEPKNYA